MYKETYGRNNLSNLYTIYIYIYIPIYKAINYFMVAFVQQSTVGNKNVFYHHDKGNFVLTPTWLSAQDLRCGPKVILHPKKQQQAEHLPYLSFPVTTLVNTCLLINAASPSSGTKDWIQVHGLWSGEIWAMGGKRQAKVGRITDNAPDFSEKNTEFLGGVRKMNTMFFPYYFLPRQPIVIKYYTPMISFVWF